jgi:hypothetical protein
MCNGSSCGSSASSARASEAPAGQRPGSSAGRPDFGRSPQQRGDFSVGHDFIHYANVDLPAGIALSDAWRIGRSNVDFLIESQFAHGTYDALIVELGASAFTGMAGVRFWGGSRYGQSVGAFGEVLAGFATVKATLGSISSASVTGFAFQPGGGVEIPVSKTVAIRPQVDFPIGDFDGAWTSAVRFNVNVVFRLFNQQ